MNEQLKNIWHSIEVNTAFEKLGSSENGLGDQEAKKRLKQYGSNLLNLKNIWAIPYILIRQLHNPIVYVLLFSTVLAVLFGNITDSIVVFSVVILNTLIGFIQEYRAHKIIKALSSIIPHKTTVIREGHKKLIHSVHVVPGDVVVLEAGDRICADLRLFSVKNLHCDESTLTGESLPVNKRIEAVDTHAMIADQKCMAFNGTYVTSGMGLGIVIATGLKTEFGKISEMIEHILPLETPMSLAIRKIATWITVGVLLISILMFIIGYLRGNSIFDAGFSAMALAVAAIPEGLPAIITITSSIGVRRMARRQAIIRQLPAVEALGSTSIICTDKTGTLTYNEMTVQKVCTPSGCAFITGGGYTFEGSLSIPDNTPHYQEIGKLISAAILCSDASLSVSSQGLSFTGDPTEVALLIAGRKIKIDEEKLREVWSRKDLLPFESERKMMASLNTVDHGQSLFIKGAPEEICALCEHLNNEETQKEIEKMALEGMRVLAIATKTIDPSINQIDEKDLKGGFTLLGLIAMIDPPRKEVYLALKSCYNAGIQVKMITGDHPLTAQAIGKDLGILGEGKVITGQEMNQLKDEEWKEAALKAQVFARVSPEHKLKLVETFQQCGHVVAMTGDGVNDAAALKRADIGIAMGIKGTAVAKEASDMILADDNFANIEAAVEEGRRVYDNLVKALAFVLPTSLGQALVILLAVLFFPVDQEQLLHPMSPVQILWVNLVVAVALSLPLAFESAEPNIMARAPRAKNTPILSGFLLLKTCTVSLVMALSTIGLFLWVYNNDIKNQVLDSLALSHAQTMAVTSLMLFQVFYLFNCRFLQPSTLKKKFFSNPSIFTGVGLVIIAQIAFIYLPIMNELFDSSVINFKSWIISTITAFSIVPIIAIEKLLQQKIFKLKAPH